MRSTCFPTVQVCCSELANNLVALVRRDQLKDFFLAHGERFFELVRWNRSTTITFTGRAGVTRVCGKATPLERSSARATQQLLRTIRPPENH